MQQQHFVPLARKTLDRVELASWQGRQGAAGPPEILGY